MPVFARYVIVLLPLIIVLALDSVSLASNATSEDAAVNLNKSTKVVERRLRRLESLPIREDGLPVEVQISAVILDIEDFDCFKMEFKIIFLLRQSWRDPRITQLVEQHQNESNTNVQLDPQTVQHLWKPDTFLSNGRDVTTTNVGFFLTPHEKIIKSERISAKAKCTMNFGLFPFDHQHCFLEIHSYHWPKRDLHYRLDDDEEESGDQNAIALDHDIASVLQFHVTDFRAEVSTALFNGEKYSLFRVSLKFRRLWSSYFGTYYLSMTCFVSLSLLSLWLVYPKISAIVNCFNIAFVNIFLVLYKNHLDIPKVYYITAMEIYSAFCVSFIILVLLVNVYVLYYVKAEEEEDESRRIRREREGLEFSLRAGNRKHVIRTVSQPASPQPVNVSRRPSDDGSTANQSNWKIIKSNLMDKVRRNSHWTLLFGFMIFNAIYWIVMLTIHYAS